MGTLINRNRVLLAVVTFMHGIGHVLFLVPLLGLADWGQSTHSWLLTGSFGGVIATAVGSLLWLASIAGFAGVSVGLLRNSAWLRAVAICSAISSLAGVLLFWGGANGFGSSAFFAALVDIAVLAIAWATHSHEQTVASA